MDRAKTTQQKKPKNPNKLDPTKHETDKTGQRHGGLDNHGQKDQDYYESDRNPTA